MTIDNGADWRKPNTFGADALESLAAVLDELEGGDWRGLLVTGKPLVFAAGADLTQFPGITPERARQGGQAGHALFGRVRALPFPTLAAVNGAALGGGLELALHCDDRTLASNVRHLGFPEVFLGLFPAWGGTQLLPRLVGAEAAVKLIVDNPLRQNRLTRADEALALGLVDHVLEPVEFLDESLELLVRTIESGCGRPGRRRPRRRRGRRAQGARAGRRRGPRPGARPLPRARADRGRGALEARGGLRRRGGRARRAPPGRRGAGGDLRVRRRRAAAQAPRAAARGRAAADRARRDRRRRADGDPARDALPPPARGARRAHGRRRRAGGGGGRVDPRRARRRSSPRADSRRGRRASWARSCARATVSTPTRAATSCWRRCSRSSASSARSSRASRTSSRPSASS